MNRNQKAKQAASELLKRHKTLQVDLDYIVFVLETVGCDIIEFAPQNNSVNVQAIVDALHLNRIISQAKSFVYQQDKLKLVFVRDDLDAEEKEYALAHELGHVICGHMDQRVSCDVSVAQEQEANEFAHYLLTPTIGFCSKKWFLRHKGLLIGAGIVGILTLILVFGVRQYQNCTYYGNYYITDSGSKYHIRDCIYIEGKKSLNRMTIRDYKSGAYEPCKVCIVKSK